MGNNCGSVEQIKIVNRCSGYTGATSGSETGPSLEPVLENFCTYSGSGGNSSRKQWCGYVGNAEWGDAGKGGSCNFDECSRVNQVSKTGCCSGCCSTEGKGALCGRERFTGFPGTCCFNDYAGCGISGQSENEATIDLCWANNNALGIAISNNPSSCNDTNCTGTCDPCLRDVTSDVNTTDGLGRRCGEVFQGPNWESGTGFCQDVVMKYCTGADLEEGNTSWILRWMNADGSPVRYGCLNAMVRNLYKGSPNNCGLTEAYFKLINSDTNCSPLGLTGASVEGVNYSSDLITQTFDRYQEDGFIVGSLPGFPGYNPFQDFMYSNVCCRFPNLCQSSLNSVCSAYTTTQLSANPSVANWCGCYLPRGEYSKYVDQYQVNPECTPPCNRPTAIPRVNPGGQPVRCTNDTCIIDDLAINLAQTNVGGTVNISQMCANCSPAFDPISGQNPNGYNSNSASCSCSIENNQINIVNSELGTINISQSCTSTTCYVTDATTGNLVSIPCDEVSDPQAAIEAQQAEIEAQARAAQAQRNRNILIVLGIALLIVFIAAFLLRPKGPQPGTRYVPRRPVDSEGSSFSSTVGSQDIDSFGSSSFSGQGVGSGSFDDFNAARPLNPKPSGGVGSYGSLAGIE